MLIAIILPLGALATAAGLAPRGLAPASFYPVLAGLLFVSSVLFVGGVALAVAQRRRTATTIQQQNGNLNAESAENAKIRKDQFFFSVCCL